MLKITKKKILLLIIPIFFVFFFVIGFVFRLALINSWNYLIVNEVPKPADVIIVLSGATERVEYGVELYQSGYSNKLLLTGSGASQMKRRAMSLGVTEDNIIIENRSHTTFENAKNSLEIVQAQGFRSVIVVTSALHTRRASVIFNHLFQGLDLTICSVPYDSTAYNNWWKNKQLSKNIITEYMKLVWHYLFER